MFTIIYFITLNTISRLNILPLHLCSYVFSLVQNITGQHTCFRLLHLRLVYLSSIGHCFSNNIRTLDPVSCCADQTSISENTICWQRSYSELCSGRDLLWFFFPGKAKWWKVGIMRNVLLVCLLSMSWSCREQCTGKTVHYGRSEGGNWQKGGGGSLMRPRECL